MKEKCYYKLEFINHNGLNVKYLILTIYYPFYYMKLSRYKGNIVIW